MLSCIICRDKGTFFVSAHFNIIVLRKNSFMIHLSHGAQIKNPDSQIPYTFCLYSDRSVPVRF